MNLSVIWEIITPSHAFEGYDIVIAIHPSHAWLGDHLLIIYIVWLVIESAHGLQASSSIINTTYEHC